MYDLELDQVVSEVKKHGANRVLLQLPDGMRNFAVQLVEAISKSTGSQVFLSGDSCFGACDIANSQAQELDVDLIIHYGHTRYIPDSKIPVLYIHANIDINVNQLIENVIPELGDYTRIGIATTVQHIHQIKEIKDKMTLKGITPITGSGAEKTPLDGQILGCSYSTVIAIKDEVDVFLYIGGGRFHPTGILLSTGKPVITANPYSGKISHIVEKDLMNLAKRRAAMISYSKSATIFGILISRKPGQVKLREAEEISKRLTEIGKVPVLIYLDEVRSEHLNNYSELEVFVNTACPRIAIDGVEGIDRPMLTINELKVVMGDLKWEDLWGNSYME